MRETAVLAELGDSAAGPLCGPPLIADVGQQNDK